MWRILIEMIGALGGALGIAVMLGQMENVVGKFLEDRKRQEGKSAPPKP